MMNKNALNSFNVNKFINSAKTATYAEERMELIINDSLDIKIIDSVSLDILKK